MRSVGKEITESAFQDQLSFVCSSWLSLLIRSCTFRASVCMLMCLSSWVRVFVPGFKAAGRARERKSGMQSDADWGQTASCCYSSTCTYRNRGPSSLLAQTHTQHRISARHQRERAAGKRSGKLDCSQLSEWKECKGKGRSPFTHSHSSPTHTCVSVHPRIVEHEGAF